MIRRALATTLAVGAIGVATLWRGDLVARQQAGTTRTITSEKQASAPIGHSETLLPDGRVLRSGGEGTEAAATILDPRTGATTPAGRLQTPRSWHTATVLPDGTVLIVGGQNGGVLI